MNARSEAETGEMLAKLNGGQQQRLVENMNGIRESLGPPRDAGPAFSLARTGREISVGVIARHGELYAQEYQWDSSFEGLVAEIAGKFLTHFEPQRERCWIAENDSGRLGCVFLVKQSGR